MQGLGTTTEAAHTLGRHICPARDNGSEITGCGHTFEAEPDAEGWVDCPSCGVAFNADRSAAEVRANV